MGGLSAYTNNLILMRIVVSDSQTNLFIKLHLFSELLIYRKLSSLVVFVIFKCLMVKAIVR